MSFATKLPAVLQQPHGNSLSIERVLKLALELLIHVPVEGNTRREDQVNTCESDLRDMLRAIDRG